jgi:hypothetical protein
MSKFANRLLINVEHGADLKFFSTSGVLLARGYLRVVIGKRGPYVEFSRDHIDWDAFSIPEYAKFRLTNNVVFYDEYRSVMDNVMLYFQKRTVAYADYKVGLCYISPFDLLRDELQPVILGEA